MEYIISKVIKDEVVKIYKADPNKGSVLFKGHKLSVPKDLLFELLDSKYILSTNKILFPDYSIIHSEYNGIIPLIFNNNVWKFSNIEDSWLSLIDVLSEGKWFSKIYIVSETIRIR